MKGKLKTTCSFCGIKNIDPKCKYIIATEKVGICEDCVFTCIGVIQDELRKHPRKSEINETQTVSLEIP